MIHVYYMKMNGDCPEGQSLALFTTLYQMLPPERQEAVKRAKNEMIAKKRIYTGAFLQRILSKETGLSMEQLQYEYNEWGKPELAGEQRSVYFNLSHSGDYVVLAVSDGPIGIDIEHKSKNYLSLTKRCFCLEEYEDILSFETEEERQRRFLEYWTMKEAYIKCVGEGMRIPLNSFLIRREDEDISIAGSRVGKMSVSEGHGSHLDNQPTEDARSWFVTLPLEEGYYMSLCANNREDIGNILKNREDYIWNILPSSLMGR